jgi:hypothetical protein
MAAMAANFGAVQETRPGPAAGFAFAGRWII